jgi:hypothetical protein
MMPEVNENTGELTLDAHESLCLDFMRDAAMDAVEAFNCTTQKDWEDESGLLRNQPLFSALCRLRTQSRIVDNLFKETKDA